MRAFSPDRLRGALGSALVLMAFSGMGCGLEADVLLQLGPDAAPEIDQQNQQADQEDDVVPDKDAVACRSETDYLSSDTRNVAYRRLDDQGRRAERFRDFGDDGDIDTGTRFFYLDDGREQGSGSVDLESGEAELDWTWVYEDGLQVAAEVPYGDTPTIAQRYTHDELGRKVTEEELLISPYLMTYSYVEGAPDQIEQIKMDWGPDGELDGTATYTYDEQGFLEMLTWFGADGEPDSRTHYHYDAEGRLELEERDGSADGTIGLTVTHFYTCPEPMPALPYES